MFIRMMRRFVEKFIARVKATGTMLKLFLLMKRSIIEKIKALVIIAYRTRINFFLIWNAVINPKCNSIKFALKLPPFVRSNCNAVASFLEKNPIKIGFLYLFLSALTFTAWFCAVAYAGVLYVRSPYDYRLAYWTTYYELTGFFVLDLIFISIPLLFLGLVNLCIRSKQEACQVNKFLTLLNLILFSLAFLTLVAAALQSFYGVGWFYKLFVRVLGSFIKTSGGPSFDVTVLGLYLANLAIFLASANILWSLFKLNCYSWWVWPLGVCCLFVLLVFCPGIFFLLLSYNNFMG